MSEQRERFEAWAVKQGINLARFDRYRYADNEAKATWAAWQAACPEGWLIVPSSPTPKMIDAAEEGHMPFGDMGFAIQCAIAHAPRPGHT